MNDIIEDFEIMQEKLDGVSYRSKRFKLFVISSFNKEQDGHIWQHVSLSRLDRKMPTYEQMKLVKERFIGNDKTAVEVFAKKSKHVNIHPTCRHLWACEREIIPDFTNGFGSI